MVYTHQKSYEPEVYADIKSAFDAVEKKQTEV